MKIMPRKPEDRIGLAWIVSELACIGTIFYGLVNGKPEVLLLFFLMAIITVMAGMMLEKIKKTDKEHRS